MSTQKTKKGSVSRKTLLLVLIIFLVATTSFALGYFASQINKKTPIIIEKN